MPPASWRKALAEVEGVIVNPAVSDLAIGNVLTVSLGRDGFNVLKPGEDFSMRGRGFPADGTEVGAVTLRDGAGDGLVEVTLPGGKKGDCRFTASRKVRIVGD